MIRHEASTSYIASFITQPGRLWHESVVINNMLSEESRRELGLASKNDATHRFFTLYRRSSRISSDLDKPCTLLVFLKFSISIVGDFYYPSERVDSRRNFYFYFIDVDFLLFNEK